MERDYMQDIKIDVNDLAGEWQNQASLYLYYSEGYSEAIRDRDKAKNDLEIIDAQLDKEIRRDWEKHFDKSPTETAIKGWIIQQEKHKKYLDIYSKLSHTANLLQSAKNALDHKRKALENLVSLKIAGFHSEPKVNKEITRGRHLGLGSKKRIVYRKKQ
jgi:hypothetical protein